MDDPVEVLLSRNIRRYFDAGDQIVTRSPKAVRKVFDQILALADNGVRTRVEKLGLCLEGEVGRDTKGDWIRYFGRKARAEARDGVAEELVWRMVHLSPPLAGSKLRDGTVMAKPFFEVLGRVGSKQVRSELLRAATYVGGATFDAAMHAFYDSRDDKPRFRTLKRLLNQRG